MTVFAFLLSFCVVERAQAGFIHGSVYLAPLEEWSRGAVFYPTYL